MALPVKPTDDESQYAFTCRMERLVMPEKTSTKLLVDMFDHDFLVDPAKAAAYVESVAAAR